jgi:hypothetical protein
MNYNTVSNADVLKRTEKALTENGFLPEIVSSKAEALERIKEIIPVEASVMNGSSRTLEEIGFVDYLKEDKHGWNNLHAAVVAEKDPAKKALLRRQSVLSDYYLGSVHALTEKGDMLIASATGSQLPHLVYTSPNIILVVGAQKITPDLETAMDRLNTYVFPLEDAHMKEIGMSGSALAKFLVINKELAFTERKFHIIIVQEKLGF